MEKQILDYLDDQRVGVLALAMPDGSVHGATVHFAYKEEPFAIYIGTGTGTKKGMAIIDKGSVAASFVVGFSEDSMKTLQVDGEIRLVDPSDGVDFDEVYLGRFPEKIDRSKTPGFLPLKFVPKWWRYSDMKNKVSLSSD